MISDLLSDLCESFYENRVIIQKTFAWEHTFIYPVCASIFLDNVIAEDETGRAYVKEELVDAAKLKYCKELLKEQTGVFSNFRGRAKLPVICMLAADGESEKRLENALEVHDMLRLKFASSEYLPLVAVCISGMADLEKCEDIVSRAKNIYTLMKDEHPFLTSTEDSIFATLLAFSEKNDTELIADMEECYQMLKQRFKASNVVQSLSHVLALGEGEAEYKCQRVFDLYDGLYDKGFKYSKSFELATLGVLALLPADIDTIVDDIIEAADCLYLKSGYGRWGRFDNKQLLMHAGMVVSSAYINSNNQTMNCTAISSVISMIAAQQAAMCAIIASTAAVSATT